MNILLVGADQHNSTDGQIVEGIKHLLLQKYGLFSSTYLFLDDHNPMLGEALYPGESFDLLVVCGTPWFWDRFWVTRKYKNLKLIQSLHPEAKTIFMGVGTCMDIGMMSGTLLRGDREREKLRELCKDATMIVRDNLAHEILNNAGISNTLLPCPAFWCYGVNPPKTTKEINSIVWYDPRIGVSGGDWKDPKKFQAYAKEFLDENHMHQCEIYCAQEQDIAGALEISLPKPTVFKGHTHCRDVMSRSWRVTSGRVHCAVAAVAAGCAVRLVPVDSRAWTVEDFRSFDRQEALKQYLAILP